MGKIFFFRKTIFLGLKFEWNLSVNTERSGTDYCWLYCGKNARDQKVCCNLRLIKFQFLKMRPILAGSLASHTRPGEKRKENSAFSTFIIQNIASIKEIEARYSIQPRNISWVLIESRTLFLHIFQRCRLGLTQ